ncbi:hypothetical protein SOVF_141880 isoform B [Spinacia oleracea]|nr:hypothetical protein SOVF_141880 isoform B [Spinacia oleracea]
MRRGTDFDLVVSNAQTDEEYLDEAMLIPKSTSVLVRRVPGLRRMNIVADMQKPKVENNAGDDQPAKSNITSADSSGFLDFGPSVMDDEFGSSIYDTIPEITPGNSSNPVQDLISASKADEDNKIKALVENSGLDWQNSHTDGFGQGSGFGRGGQGGRGFGRGGTLESKTPPQGYVCHRCKVPGHFIQHCPTNGDPNYDIKKVRPATGIPKSMLVPTLDGSFALPCGTVAVLKPNEAAFEKEMEGVSSTRSLGDLPPELHCPLCKEVMKEAVLSSKCCFGSFCDKCIRDYIISKSMCVCGTRDVLADDLVPNKTLRSTIKRILESPGNSSVDNPGSLNFQDMQSAHCPQPNTPSPTQSAVSNVEQMLPPDSKETSNVKENITKVPDVPEATQESITVKEPASQGIPLPVVDEIRPKVASNETDKKKKKRKESFPVNASGMQWMQPSMDGYAFNPCQTSMQPAVNGFMGPFGGNMPYNMGYGNGMDLTFGNFIPPEFYGPQGFMMPPMLPPPQRDFATKFGTNMNVRPTSIRNEEFVAGKFEVQRKKEMERRVERDLPNKDRDYGREASSNANVPPVKSKHKPTEARNSSREEHNNKYHDHDHDYKRENKRTSMDHHDRDHDNHHRVSHSHRDSYLPRHALKRKPGHYEVDYDMDQESRPCGRSKSSSSRQQPFKASAGLSDKHKMRAYSRINFQDEEPSKKRRQVCV